jgi:hypothetical protein
MALGLLIIGILLVLAGLVGYVIFNPHVIQDFRNAIQAITRSTNDARQLASDLQGLRGRVSPDASVDERFFDLRLHETVDINPDKKKVLERKERSVSCHGTLEAQERNRREFRDRGEPWRFIMLDDEVMLFLRPDGWNYFEKRSSIVLTGESARAFDTAGEEFSKRGQVARSHSFTWSRKKWTILDVGYLRFDRLQGACRLNHGEMIKYLLAEDEGGNLMYVENLKTGTDRVWLVGKALGMSIEPYVDNILRAA